MKTKVSEIASDIYRLSTHVPQIAEPAGFTFCQFLVLADEPLLFHCGARGLFPLVSAAVEEVMPLERLRWISFGHVEADECGAMNSWLAAAPHAQVVHGMTACMVSLNDLADRAPRPLANGEVLDLGGKRMRWLDTPHVPHAWEAGLLYEETTETLLCGDLFTQTGDNPALTQGDIIAPAVAAEDMFGATSLGPATAPTIRELIRLQPKTLGLMHGPSFNGDVAAALEGLAADYARRLEAAVR